ncbi:MAG: SRPBCC domain-containing protein [Nannocystaceae bacterium]
MSTPNEVLFFLNLPTADLKRTRAFYAELGFAFDARFSNDQAQSMILSDKAYVMWLSQAFFDSFGGHGRPDPHTTTAAFNCVSQPSRAAVDALVDRALSLGARPAGSTQDHGFMYGRSFYDLDGHCWEVTWMDVDAAVDCGGDNNELMISSSGEDRIRILRPVEAPIDRVFAAYTEPALLERWCGACNSMTMIECAFEARVGGAYRYVWKTREGGRVAMSGEILELEAPTRLVTSERWDDPWYEGSAHIEWTFHADGARTIIVQEVVFSEPSTRDAMLTSNDLANGMSEGFAALDRLLSETSA